MAHPRAKIQKLAVKLYKSNGLEATADKVKCSAVTLRRWLVENGVEIRKHGTKAGIKQRKP